MGMFSQERCLICHEEMVASATWRGVFLGEEVTGCCSRCLSKLEAIGGETCRICGRELDSNFCKEDLCLDCVRWEEDGDWAGMLDSNISLFHYNDFLRETIARYKFRGDYVLARVFAEKIEEVLRKVPHDYLVPIPLSEERLYERGFNQSEALILEAGREATLLLARIHSEKQSKKSRKDRIHLPQVFTLGRNEELTGKTIMLVDDIYTTGSTIRHAAKILKGAGAARIHSVTIAR
ncbi:ComF family protein [Bacillus massilinigeriensis]|uniref:ComF family protein n=1 Tax=Bacillus mediterraneensis TaxID=1805474 RepID=UPI0008F96655|nr:ComF family protein [Bacillus mediterraneensis]